MYDVFLQELIQVNMIPICIILFLVVFLRFNDPYEHELTKAFYPILLMLLALVALDNFDYYSYDIRNNGLTHTLIAFLGYNLRITILLALIQVMLVSNKRDPKKEKGVVRKRLMIYAPAFICLFITSLSFFTHLVFWYGEDGRIRRGPLAYTPHIVALYYALMVLAFAVFIYRKYGRKNESVVICMTTVLSLLATFVEMKFALRGILIGIFAMTITFYYLCLHIEYFKYDILTGALNRTSFLADQQKFGAKGGGFVVLIDLNDLKKINDKEGHTEGDLALKTLAETVTHALPFGTMLYRIGGDEFMLFCSDLDEQGVKDLIANISERMQETKYSCAMGYALWDGKSPFDEAYKQADAGMYENKPKRTSGRRKKAASEEKKPEEKKPEEKKSEEKTESEDQDTDAE